MKETNTLAQEGSFKDFVFRDKVNRRYFYIAAVGALVQFIAFKYFYPFADFFQDSYSFIDNARTLDGFNIWPIGYSRFLYIIHLITHSDTVVVGVQYFLQAGSILLFFFSVLYWYPFSRGASTFLFVVLFVSPLTLYISNYISSDSLFASLSLLWLTQLLWIIHRPRNWHFVVHAIILFLAFTVRYHAMYYPVISLVAFFLSHATLRVKLAGIVLPAILIGSFVIWTRNKAYEMTGVHQFTVLSGWHWGNNALYMYPHVDVDSTKVPLEARTIDQMTRAYFDSVPSAFKEISPRAMGGFYFGFGPLKDYRFRYHKFHPNSTVLEDWAVSAPVFSVYGKHLIRQHPLAYFRYYILPNTMGYIIPPLEYLELYNEGYSKVDPRAKDWFDFKSTDIRSVSFDLQGNFLGGYALLFLIINLGFPAASFWFLSRSNAIIIPQAHRGVMLITILWFATLLLSVLAAPIALRYMVFPFVAYTAFSVLLASLWISIDDKKDASQPVTSEKVMA